jgi:hypothetical protein
MPKISKQESNQQRYYGLKRTGERGPRTQPDRRSFGANNLHDGIYNFECKSRAILDASAIFVCAVVADVLNELVD